MEYYLEIVGKFLLAIVVGGLIGYERKMKNKPAGYITHTLVCIGACVIAIVQVNLVKDVENLIMINPELKSVLKIDSGRLIAQVVSGIGFLGAGSIIQNRGSVRGITTAATLWVVACIGIAIGMGHYFLSFLSAAGVFFVLVILKKIEDKLMHKYYTKKLELEFLGNEMFLEDILKILKKEGMQINNIEFYSNEKKERKFCRLTIIVPYDVHEYTKIFNELNYLDNIKNIKIR